MEYVWSQVDRRGDQSLPTELKMGTMKNILPMNYISELSDFITALIFHSSDKIYCTTP